MKSLHTNYISLLLRLLYDLSTDCQIKQLSLVTVLCHNWTSRETWKLSKSAAKCISKPENAALNVLIQELVYQFTIKAGVFNLKETFFETKSVFCTWTQILGYLKSPLKPNVWLPRFENILLSGPFRFAGYGYITVPAYRRIIFALLSTANCHQQLTEFKLTMLHLYQMFYILKRKWTVISRVYELICGEGITT